MLSLLRVIPPSIIYAGVLLAAMLLSETMAQETLTRGQVYTVRNQVSLDRQNQGSWQPATVGAQIIPRDAVRTGGQSRAELLFNEGTLIRTGENTTFRFPPGRRNFEIINGSSLIMIRPGLGASQIDTPQAIIVARGTALFVSHDEALNTSLVGVLTESPAGPVTVSNLIDETTVELGPGQFVSVANGVIGLVDNFILPMFYSTVDLAEGLAPGQEAFVSQQSDAVQETINAVRAEAIPPLIDQGLWLNSFCQGNTYNIVDVVRQSSLMQWLLPTSIPPEAIGAEAISSNMVVTPLQSLSGLAWLNQHCQAQL